ncbi:MAG: isochorismatase family protein [Thermotogae bacterium]|jgi:nicotinamidase-related amidase|nr:isochorismatase family protein [Thermotogota bacterium]MDD8052944.1 isochorismatase family protein [Thermotogota bacterium]HOZ12827.1 isochorismatase family protein [Thermotogota bacterium]HPB87950.1 isochorismatase family protein [Thermotogota bacterium]HPH11110.1 isochorismatase family protein [Thermotogota bacterium]
MDQQTALFVIDVQVGLFQKSTKVYQEVAFLKNVNALIDRFHAEKRPIFFIRHANDGFLIKGSPQWQIHPDIRSQDTDLFMEKTVGSALKEKAILAKVRELNIKTIVAAGMVSHGCVKAACQEAKKLGYTVYLAQDAHSHYNREGQALIDRVNAELAEAGVILMSTEGLLSF